MLLYILLGLTVKPQFDQDAKNEQNNTSLWWLLFEGEGVERDLHSNSLIPKPQGTGRYIYIK